VAIKELIIHYESVIQELKNNKTLEMSLAAQTIEKLNQSLREKQQEVLDILERFSPLMEYKMNESSIQAERKEKIEQHYAANLDLLAVILDKYRIVVLPKK
jgi:short-subunit dehydrogenase involved in D-alanine esterification of teichoic acids